MELLTSKECRRCALKCKREINKIEKEIDKCTVKNKQGRKVPKSLEDECKKMFLRKDIAFLTTLKEIFEDGKANEMHKHMIDKETRNSISIKGYNRGQQEEYIEELERLRNL